MLRDKLGGVNGLCFDGSRAEIGRLEDGRVHMKLGLGSGENVDSRKRMLIVVPII